jgi:hypothetical protein
MTGKIVEAGGLRVYLCAGEGVPFRGVQDALDLIGETRSAGAEMAVVPVERFAAEFLELRTRLAGEFLQKFVTYGVRIAIVGDLSAQAAESKALKDFIYESNKGNSVWFLRDLAELEGRLRGKVERKRERAEDSGFHPWLA